MRFKILFVLMIFSSILISSCTPQEDEETSNISKTCQKNTDCKRNEFCDTENPIYDDATGTESYKCVKRDACSSAASATCQFGWVCCVAEKFCVKKEEYELFGSSCEETTDNNFPNDSQNDNDSSFFPDSGQNEDSNNTDSDNSTNEIEETPDQDVNQPQNDADEDTNLGTPIFTESFENGSSNWAMNGDWQVGAPTSGPSKARTGSNVVATNLSGNYSENSNSRLTYLNPITVKSNTKIVFYAYVDTEYNLYSPTDFLQIQIKTDTDVWLENKIKLETDISNKHKLLDMSLTKINGHFDDNYHRFVADLSYFKGKTITLSFLFKSDGSTCASGIYLDDISLY